MAVSLFRLVKAASAGTGAMALLLSSAPVQTNAQADGQSGIPSYLPPPPIPGSRASAS